MRLRTLQTLPTWRGILAVLSVAGCSAKAPIPTAPAADPGFDLVIENGRIVDGTGNSWYYGDLAIKGDRIARITRPGLLRGAQTKDRIDARGLVVAPGFWDIQSHSRGNFLGRGDGRVVSKVTMGVTTEIMGEGSTNAIINARTQGLDPASAEGQAIASNPFAGERGFDNWLKAMEQHGASVNFGSFLGGDNVRTYAKGAAQGAPTAAELDSMRKVVRWAMEGGAFGIATALIYPPSTFATIEELIEASKAMAPYGGVYITHMRSEADQFLEGINEAIRISKEAGVPAEIFHLKAGGLRNWHKTPLAMAKIDSARAAGVDIQANMYPYIAGGTGLTACFPPWASADNKLFENLANPEMRQRMRNEIVKQTTEWENLCMLSTPANVLILGLNRPENQPYINKRLDEIARMMNKDWIEAAFDLVLSERQRVGTLYFMMDEGNVKLQLTAPWMKFGTDAGGIDPDSARGGAHPRAYGTFTRVLGKYVRDEKVIPLEDAVRKMSSAVATRLGVQDRGLLRDGFFADVTIFDPNTVADKATFEDPHQLSVGIQHVLVNGVPVVRNGKHTNAKPGRALRGPGYKKAP